MSDVRKYVVGFLFTDGHVLLVRKRFPLWQAQLLNGVGGKVEPGESFDDAMVREFQEETGLHVGDKHWDRFATLSGHGWRMGCYRASVPTLHDAVFALDRKLNDAEERLEVCRQDSVMRGQYNTIPNLRWLIPMTDPHDSKNWPYYIVERQGRVR